MEKSIKPLNYWGNSFWIRHLKVFGFLKYFVSSFIDLLQNKMYSSQLTLFIIMLYVFNLNQNLLGIFSTYSFCHALFPNYMTVSDYLLIESNFSRYSHHFYTLVFIGNLKTSPLFITIISGLYCAYDFALILVDCLYCQAVNGDFDNYASILFYSYFRLALSSIIVFYWFLVIIFPQRIVNWFDIPSALGKLLKIVFLKVFKCRLFSNIYKTIEKDFKYPPRIKIAAFVSFFLCFTTIIVIILSSRVINKVVNSLKDDLSDLEKRPYEDIFLILHLNGVYTMTNQEGKKILQLIIYILEPLYSCIVIGMSFGMLISVVSILNLLYQYKKIILLIKEEGEESETLRKVWKFRSHNAIFFCSQFVINSFLLTHIFAITVFLVAYMLSFKETAVILWDFVKSRNYGFWVGLVPVTLGTVYFHFLVDDNNFIKNSQYFCFWDTWYLLIGIIGSFVKAIARYLIGLGTMFILGFKVDTSIMPEPLDCLDTLYCGFYASIALHCLNENIIPKHIKEKIKLTEPLSVSIN